MVLSLLTWLRTLGLFGDYDCCYDIAQYSGASQAGEQDEGKPYKCGVNVKVFGNSSAYSADHAASP